MITATATKLLLCGYGSYGRRIARQIGYRRIAAICESDAVAAASARRALPGTPVFASLRSIDPACCDAVWEAASLDCRKDVHRWASEHGLPAVLEKPLATQAAGLAQYTTGRYTVDFREVYHPVLLAAQKFLESRRAHSLTFIRANTIALERHAVPNYRSGVEGGAFLDKGIHDVANLFWRLLPPERAEVHTIEAKGSCSDSLSTAHSPSRVKGHEPTRVELRFAVTQRCHHTAVSTESSWIGLERPPADLPVALHANSLWMPPAFSRSHRLVGHGYHAKLFIAELRNRPWMRLIGSTLDRPGMRPFLAIESPPGDLRRLPLTPATDHHALSLEAAANATDQHRREILDVHRISVALNDAVFAADPHTRCH